MTATTIEWTDEVWNPVTGCTKVSQGCKHCYAERVFPRPYPDRAFTDVQCHPERLEAPLRWKKPRRIFVNSMSDLFHEAVPEDFIWSILVTISNCRRHTFQVLTKRPERMVKVINTSNDYWLKGQSLPNLWLGVSVEDQTTADERIPLLLRTRAAVRFLSCEPLLGPVDLTPFFWGKHEAVDDVCQNCLRDADCECGYHTRTALKLPALHWVIVGGESGPRARPMHPDWVRSLRDQCTGASVPFFFKQWGNLLPVDIDRLGDGTALVCADDGSAREIPGPVSFEHLGIKHFARVSKSRAGRMLDGRAWDEVPR